MVFDWYTSQNPEELASPVFRFVLTLFALSLMSPAALAQGADVALGISSFDPDAPVEVTADELSIDQSTGAATFDGNVLVVQGDVRMSAGVITVFYAQDENGSANGIAELRASEGVTVVTPTDAAEAAEAVYAVSSGQVILAGSVLLTQGQTALSGDRLTLDLNAGTGRMEGRVRTVIGGNQN